MKIIDLLIDIKEDKLLPNKIKVSDYIYKLDINDLQYYRCIDKEKELYRSLLEDISLHNAYVWINLEYEIIEDKEIEVYDYCDNYEVMNCKTIANNFLHLNEDLEKIVKEINILKKKAKNE